MTHFNLRCSRCERVGTRTFARIDGRLRDVLGGPNGVQAADCRCDCGNDRLALVIARSGCSCGFEADCGGLGYCKRGVTSAFKDQPAQSDALKEKQPDA